MDNQANKNIQAFLAGTVFGAVIGVVTGLLVSPGSGQENREYIAKQAQAVSAKGKEFAETAKRTVSADVDKIMKKLKPTINDAATLSTEEKNELKTQVAELLESEPETPKRGRKRS